MTSEKLFTVGVLALQGAFAEHIQHFQEASVGLPYSFVFIEVRTPAQLSSCDALTIPGGESSSMSLVAERTGMLEPLVEYIKAEKPLWGTCAGLIFLSKRVLNGRSGQKVLGALDILVARNAFGRQSHSFEAPLDFSSFIPGQKAFPTVFIRAPVVSGILQENTAATFPKLKLEGGDTVETENDYKNARPVEVLHQLDDGLVVAVRQGHVLGTSFHPELSEEYGFHRWFLEEFVLKTEE